MKRAILILLFIGLPFASQAAVKRTLQTSMPAARITHVTIDAGVGQLKLTPSPDDKLHVQVGLEQKSVNFLWFFHWMSHTTAREIAAVKLQQKAENDGVTYSLDYPGHLDDGDVKQNWTIEIPARMAVKIRMKVGELHLSGISGGVDAKLEVGEVTLKTPRGPIKAVVNVGQIRATSATTQVGNIHMSSSIGDAQLQMPNWNDNENNRSGLGRTVNVAGKGPDSMDLEVNIGDARLSIEPATAAGK